MKSQFFIICCVAVAFGVVSSVPFRERELFWYPTDKGTVVPAFLKGGPASTQAVEDDVEFWHYLAGEKNGRLVEPDCQGCTAAFVRGAPLVVLAHGFGSDHVGGFGNNHRNGFETRGEPVNLVFVNWSKLAQAPWYETAANNVKPVGEYSAKLINFLVAQGVATLDNTFFVGHSLGSHVANYVTLNTVGGKIRGVFALDPALPLFGVKEDNERIDPEDGQFVNVIHTSMGTLLDGGLAFTEPRGHVDFYPNSGKDQPGCPGFDFGACSHSRSYGYLGESIGRPSAFPACKCDNWEDYDAGRCTCLDQAPMGWDTPRTTRGVYYLRTNANSPYGQGS
ncbi:Lipase member H [Orchesella cincta]|uniref:Lipase member H n=1 Tax=Orchesella cincta TaxID=48709 RepID=A0A1D2NIC5_ORCCI|nr:Lipase member H [Orchesella cincta]